MFEIYSLKIGELYIPHGEGILRDPVHCWLVTDGDTRILVDSGMPDIEEVTRTLKIRGKGGGHTGLSDALSRIDLKPKDIDFIIPTHLHFDHAYNLDLFPDACVIVQREEIISAIDPIPTHRIFYPRIIVNEVINRKRPKHLRIIDGDYQFMDGFLILKLPSHTPGMQVPIVTTERGKAALVSDMGDHYRYWFPADSRATENPKKFLSDSFLPNDVRSEGERTFGLAMQRVLDHADIVVPAHDSRIPKKIPEEWFAIPESTDGDIGKLPPEDD